MIFGRSETHIVPKAARSSCHMASISWHLLSVSGLSRVDKVEFQALHKSKCDRSSGLSVKDSWPIRNSSGGEKRDPYAIKLRSKGH